MGLVTLLEQAEGHVARVELRAGAVPSPLLVIRTRSLRTPSLSRVTGQGPTTGRT